MRTALLLSLAALAACARPAGPAPLPVWELAPPQGDEAARWGAVPSDGDQVLTREEILDRVVRAHPLALEGAAEARASRAERAASRAWLAPEVEGRAIPGEAGPELEGSLTVALSPEGPAAARVGTLGLRAAEWEQVVAQRESIREARLLLAHLAHARAREALLEDLADRSAELAELARQRRAAAVADPLDVSLVLADAARDRRAFLDARETADLHEAEIRALAGIPTSLGTIEPGPLRRVLLVEEGDLVEDARRQGDAWVASHLRLRLAEGELSRASLGMVPELRLGPALVSSPDDTAMGVAAGVGVPLLGGELGDLRAARARRDGAAAALEAEGRHTVLLIQAQRERLHSLESQQEALEGEARQAAAQALELARSRYEAGRLDVLLLLSAHRAHAAVETEILDLRLAHVQALLELERLVGRPMRTVPVEAQ